jgi:transcriptional regulator with XRE-family HTH domain/tetratricopeptide (TPR) repeat protein
MAWLVNAMDGLDDEIGLVLTILRSIRGWNQAEWAQAARMGASSLSEYETGGRVPNLQTLERLFSALGLPLSAAARTRTFIAEVRGSDGAVLPAPMGPDLLASIGHVVASLTREAGEFLARDLLYADDSFPPVTAPRAEDREAAPGLMNRLLGYSAGARKALVTELGRFRNWALCETLCAESTKAAARDHSRALELAELALQIAECLPGEEAWRYRLQGYAWAHVGNAARVANDFAGADLAFEKSDFLWQAGASADPELLEPSRILELKASLRRDERRLAEAIALLDSALAVRQNPEAAGRILIMKALTLEKLGEYEVALDALRQASPWIEGEGSPRLRFSLKFNLLVNLCHTGRFAEGASIMDDVRGWAAGTGNDLDILRVRWLEGRVMAGLGRREEAIAALEAVRAAFTSRTMAFDAALASLEVAMLLLEDGRTREVKALAEEMFWIFNGQGVGREALAAFKLFSEAASREALTLDLVRRYTEDFRKEPTAE